MEALSNVDWLTLVLGIILGLPVAYGISIVANMHTPRLVQYLENRKLLKTHKTRQQAIATFNRIKAFHEGRRDKYSFYIVLATTSVLFAIFASTLILIISIQNHEYPVTPEYAILLVLAALCVAATLISVGSLYETSRQLDRFDEYKAEFETRWGPIGNGHDRPMTLPLSFPG